MLGATMRPLLVSSDHFSDHADGHNDNYDDHDDVGDDHETSFGEF